MACQKMLLLLVVYIASDPTEVFSVLMLHWLGIYWSITA